MNPLDTLLPYEVEGRRCDYRILGWRRGGVIWGPHRWADVHMGETMRDLVLKYGIKKMGGRVLGKYGGSRDMD